MAANYEKKIWKFNSVFKVDFNENINFQKNEISSHLATQSVQLYFCTNIERNSSRRQSDAIYIKASG